MVRAGLLGGNGAKMEYWNEIITQKSWSILQKIRKEMDFVLIGGWAVYLWTKSHKSKDIDIVVSQKELGKLKFGYTLNKNDSLKKYEIKIDDVDIDIYLPYYSKLPLLDSINNHASVIEGFKVLKPEALLVLKQAAEISRKDSEKGLKDRIDIMDLLIQCDINFLTYKNVLEKEKLVELKNRLIEIITKFHEIKYIDLNPRQFKLKKEQLIKSIKK